MTTTNKTVCVVSTGTANLASVAAAIRRVGAEVRFVDDVESVETADWLVLPGVGAFDAAMQRLEELSLVEPLRRRIEDQRPTLAICLG